MIATLTTDKLTENLKIVNNDSLDKDADTLNEQYVKELGLKVVEREKNRAQAAEEVLTRVNLGTVEEPKETQIGSFFNGAEKEDLIQLLKEFVDVFAWSYKDMPGLDPVHC